MRLGAPAAEFRSGSPLARSGTGSPGRTRRRENLEPPRFGETEGSVYFLRNADVMVQQVRLEGGELKYLVRNAQGKAILVGEAFLKKNVRLHP